MEGWRGARRPGVAALRPRGQDIPAACAVAAETSCASDAPTLPAVGGAAAAMAADADAADDVCGLPVWMLPPPIAPMPPMVAVVVWRPPALGEGPERVPPRWPPTCDGAVSTGGRTCFFDDAAAAGGGASGAGRAGRGAGRGERDGERSGGGGGCRVSDAVQTDRQTDRQTSEGRKEGRNERTNERTREGGATVRAARPLARRRRR